MKIACQKDSSHKHFYVTAHVTEEWVVDEGGDFLNVVDGSGCDVVHRPDSQDLYTCRDCGTEGKVA